MWKNLTEYLWDIVKFMWLGYFINSWNVKETKETTKKIYFYNQELNLRKSI